MRIRPTVGDAVLRKVSKDSLSVDERNFTFDAVFNSDSTQVWQFCTAFLQFIVFSFESMIIWIVIQVSKLNKVVAV